MSIKEPRNLYENGLNPEKQRNFFNKKIEESLGINAKDIKALVSKATSETETSGPSPFDEFECNLCLGLVYEPMICKDCQATVLCQQCISQLLVE